MGAWWLGGNGNHSGAAVTGLATGGKKPLSAAAISARSGAPEMTTSTMVSDVWVCPLARMRRAGTPAVCRARA